MPLLINIIQNLLKLRYFLEKNVNAPEDLDSESSANPEVNKNQDVLSISNTEVPEDMDADSSFIPEVP